MYIWRVLFLSLQFPRFGILGDFCEFCVFLGSAGLGRIQCSAAHFQRIAKCILAKRMQDEAGWSSTWSIPIENTSPDAWPFKFQNLNLTPKVWPYRFGATKQATENHGFDQCEKQDYEVVYEVVYDLFTKLFTLHFCGVLCVYALFTMCLRSCLRFIFV